jgi:cytochrome c biogenesis protein CcdA
MNISWYSEIVGMLSFIQKPLWDVYNSQSTLIIAILLLGIMAAFSPSQVSINLGAIAYTIRRMTKNEKWYIELISFLIGKTLVLSVFLGLIFWIGAEWRPSLEIGRKVVGLLFLLTGLYYIVNRRWEDVYLLKLVKDRLSKLPKHWRGFFIGVLLSTVFCPTLYMYFFTILIPSTIHTGGYSILFLIVFSFGSLIPTLLFAGLAFGFGVDQKLFKNQKKLVKRIQYVSGITLFLIGINEIILYWT